MRVSRVLCATATLLALGSPAAAQTVSDTQVWTAAGTDIELPHALELGYEFSLRFHNDADDLKSAFHEVSLRHEVNDYLRVRGGYRYYMDREGDTAHRYFGDADLRYGPDAEPWKIGYRSRLQTTTRPDPDEDLTYWRNRVSAEYEARDGIEPFASFELFYRFRDQDPDEMRRWRVTAGVDWDVWKRTKLSTFYLFQHELNVDAPEQDHVFGVELSYEIDRR